MAGFRISSAAAREPVVGRAWVGPGVGQEVCLFPREARRKSRGLSVFRQARSCRQGPRCAGPDRLFLSRGPLTRQTPYLPQIRPRTYTDAGEDHSLRPDQRISASPARSNPRRWIRSAKAAAACRLWASQGSEDREHGLGFV